VTRPHARALHLEVFSGVRDITLAGRDPVADNSWSDHVGDEFVPAAVPNEEDGTRTAAAVELRYAVGGAGRELHFVLRNAGGPQQANDFGFLCAAQAGDYLRCTLPQVTRGAGHLPLLIERTSEDFDFRAKRTLIVG